MSSRGKDKGGMKVPESTVYNMDCMEYLKTVPDKFFDLAVVDPPYGGGASNTHTHTGGLVGGLGEYKGAVSGRFGGRFEKYHLGADDGRDLVGGEVRPPPGCL